MISNISIGQYIPGDSLIHKLDPRTKIILSLMYIISVFLIKTFLGYFLIFLFIYTILLVGKLKFQYIYKGLKPIFMLMLISVLLNLFIIKGETLIFSLYIFKVYKEGATIALFMMIRLISMVLGTTILTLTTSSIELTDGIEKLLNPFRKIGIQSHELAMMMSIALRFIPTLIDETDKIMKAQMARGADFETGNLLKRAKSMIPILVPLFISAFRRADELAMAMEARCYRGGEMRTRMKVLKFSMKDIVAFNVVIISLLISILV